MVYMTYAHFNTCDFRMFRDFKIVLDLLSKDSNKYPIKLPLYTSSTVAHRCHGKRMKLILYN